MSAVLVAPVGDLHVGSTMGLCPSTGISLADGGVYKWNKAQRWIWSVWRWYWEEVEAIMKAHSAELWIVYLGDLVDGANPRNRQVATLNMHQQRVTVIESLRPGRILEPAHEFFVIGTEWHVGQEGQDEAAIAESVEAEINPATGQRAWYELLLNVNGCLIDCKHHGKSGKINRTKGSAINLLAQDIMSWHADAGDPIPKLALRGHVHQTADSGDNYPVRAITLPPWSLKNAFAHKVAAESKATVGSIMVLVEEDGTYDVLKRIKRVKGQKPWRPNN